MFAELQTLHVAPQLRKTGVPEWHVATDDSRPAPVSPKPGRESFLIRDHLFDTLSSSAAVGAGLKVFAPVEMLKRYGRFRGEPNTDDKTLKALHRDLWAPEGGSVSFDAHLELAGATALWVLGRLGSRVTPLASGLRVTEVHALMEDANGKVYKSTLGGVAFADHGRSGHVLVVENFGPLNETFAHELGHECFLPHPFKNDADADPQAHDPNDPDCMMGGWNRLHFCGRCILRLRGWSMDGLVVETVEPPNHVEGTHE